MKTEPEKVTPISTLGTSETRPICLIKAQNGQAPTPISYPARCIQSGKLGRAPKKTGLWFADLKYNE